MFIDNKYTKWYNQIISNATTQSFTGYCEIHHIIPRSLGGTNHLSNKVRLDARRHFVCHKLLVKMVSGNARYKMLEALSIFSNNKKRNLLFNSRDIAVIREANAIASSRRNKGNQYYKLRQPDSGEQKLQKSIKNKNSKWVNNGVEERFTQSFDYYINLGYNFGRLPVSVETIEALRKGCVRGPMSDEVKAKISSGMRGKTKSEEHKQKLKESFRSRQKYTCHHCGVHTTISNISRWHGDNCKKIKPRPIYTCAHCSTVCNNIGNFVRWHGDNCRLNVSS